ncbi:MAG: response regulator [Patescibacteria group bacterium]
MKKTKIVIIEDDKFLLKLYSNKLKSNGFEVLGAINSQEGLNKVITEKPNLILLDLVLPGKSGFEVLAEIKQNPDTKKIPVIILSNLGQESDIERGTELGAVAYFVKADLSVNHLPELIKKILGKSNKK